MARTRKTPTVHPRRSTTLVRLEPCEDRRPFGSLFALPGVPLAELSFGQLSGMLQTAPPPHFNYLHDEPAPFALIDPPAATSTTFGEPLVNPPSAYFVSEPSGPVAPSPVTASALVPLDQAFADSLGAAAWAVDPLRGFDIFSTPHSPLKQPAGADSAAEGAGIARPGDVGSGFVPGGSTEGVSAGASQPWPPAEAAGLHQAVLEAMVRPLNGNPPDDPSVASDPNDVCPGVVGPGDDKWPYTREVPSGDDIGVTTKQQFKGDSATTQGVDLTFVAFGDVVTAANGVRGDAEFYDFASSDPPPTSGPGGDGGLRVTGARLPGTPTPPWNWGRYRSQHVYYAYARTTGMNEDPTQGASIHVWFQDFDGAYANNQGSFIIKIYCGRLELPEMDPDSGCGCSGALSMAAGMADNPGNSSPGPVTYGQGITKLAATDLSSAGAGTSWGVTRSFSNHPAAGVDGLNGAGTMTSQLPYLLNYNTLNPNQPTLPPSHVALVVDGTGVLHFDNSDQDDSYVARRFRQETLKHDSAQNEFVLTDTTGNRLYFHNFNVSTEIQRGQLKKVTSPQGVDTTVQRYSSGAAQGKVEYIGQQLASAPAALYEFYVYTYYASGLERGMLQKVTLRRGTDSTPGNNPIVRVVEYQYHTPTPANQYYGPTGTLKLVQIKDAASAVLDTEYYRYWRPEDADFATKGYLGGVKYVFRSNSYERMVQAGVGPLTATDDAVKLYADLYFEYDPLSQRVTQEKTQGLGCSYTTGCEDGLATLKYHYEVNGAAEGVNTWKYKTTEQQLDASSNVLYEKIVFTNYAGQVMLTDLHAYVTPPTQPDSRWVHFYRYDAQGRLELHANPSAIVKNGTAYYNEGFGDLMYGGGNTSDYLNDTAGLLEQTSYGTSTSATPTLPGDVLGYVKATWLWRGEPSAPFPDFRKFQQSTTLYIRRYAGSPEFSIFPVAESTVYRATNATGGGTEPQTTKHSYLWHGNTAQLAQHTIEKPIVSVTKNGPGGTTGDVNISVYGVQSLQCA